MVKCGDGQAWIARLNHEVARRGGEVANTAVCPSTILSNLIEFGLEVRDPEIVRLFGTVVKRLTQLFAEQPCTGSNPVRASKKINNFWDRTPACNAMHSIAGRVIQGFESPSRLKLANS